MNNDLILNSSPTEESPDTVRFVCTVKRNREDYLQYSKYISRKNSHRSPVRKVLLGVIVAAYIGVLLYVGEYGFLTFFLGAMFALLVVFIMSKLNFKKRVFAMYDSTKKLGEFDTTLSFTDGGYTAENVYSRESLPYDKLYAIYCTEDFYYIMLTKNQGYYLVKAECPDGFDAFLGEIKKREQL